MRMFRRLMMVLAMLSVGMLPGPAHAMPRHEDGSRVSVVQHHLQVERAVAHGTQASTEASHDDKRGCPDHDHGKCCVTACCASSCLPLAEVTSLPTPRWIIVAIGAQVDDRAHAGALLGLTKRPPKTV